MLTYLLVLVLNGNPTTVPQTFPSLEACEKAGTAWVLAAKRLRGPSAGDFTCFPAEVKQ
jgi:hypothetical protein